MIELRDCIVGVKDEKEYEKSNSDCERTRM